jgi:hypothetical protein
MSLEFKTFIEHFLVAQIIMKMTCSYKTGGPITVLKSAS